MTLFRTTILAIFLGVSVPTAVFSQSMTKCVQNELSKTVFDPGSLDGVWGAETAGALNDFLRFIDVDLVFFDKSTLTGEVCELIKAHSANASALKIRRYSINLNNYRQNQNSIGSQNSANQINNKDCDIYFRQKEIGNSWSQDTMLVGNIDIKEGEIIFTNHEWFPYVWTKSAPPKYIIETNARLTLSPSKTLSGSFRYFPDDDNLDHKNVKLHDEIPTLTREKMIKYDFDFNAEGRTGEIEISCKTEI